MRRESKLGKSSIHKKTAGNSQENKGNSRKKKEHRNYKTHQKNNTMTLISSYLPVITLNENRLIVNVNFPMKRHRVDAWIKTKTQLRDA